LDGYCMYPAQFSYVIVHIRNSVSHVHFEDRCAPVNFANRAE
jgi:hypothetical protein